MRRALPLALLVGAVSLGTTVSLWRHEQQTEEAAIRASFDFAVRQSASRISQSLAGYEQMLRGAQGFFLASDDVTVDDFRTYVDALLSGSDFAGLRSISYAEAQRGPDGRIAATPVVLRAPESSQSSLILGYDLYSESVRRAAMQQAMDSGRTAITARIRLRGEADRGPLAGFLMFLPVYAKGQPNDSVEARRAHLAGWVFATFRVSDLIASLYGESAPGLDISVYDGTEQNDETLMYRLPGLPAPARFEAQEYMGFAGHTWTLDVRSQPEFEARHRLDAPRFILVAGIVLSVLLALLTYQLATGRARAHGVAQAMTRELRASEERYRRIVETANEGIWMVDAEARMSFVNPKMLQLLGYREEEMLGRPLAEFIDGVPPALVQAEDGHTSEELVWRRRDGTPMAALLSVAAVADADGHRSGALGMLTDMTDKRQAEAKRALLEAQLRESQKMEAIGTLAGGIAHDFNNIVAAILGNVALARHDLDAGHPAQRPLVQIDHAGVRARALVQQILAFSRMQPQVLVSQPLRPLVQEAVALLRSTLPASVDLQTRLAETPIHAGVDPTQIQQVLLNLCTNAWHALPGGSGRITVGLEVTDLDTDAARSAGGVAPGAYAHLWVEDNGSGMDDATRARIFEPFFTTKRIGEGTGLGLSVVHGIVSAHQGAITVDSRVGRGSTFHLYFPLRDEQAAAPPPERLPVEAPQGNGEHLLYVDDDPAMRLMVEALLLRAGYRVTVAEGPRAALDAMRTAPASFDMLVTDYNMPEHNGLDLAAEVTRLRPGLPVIVTSGYVSEEMRTAAARAGVRALLQKEYTLEQLASVAHAALRANDAAA